MHAVMPEVARHEADKTCQHLNPKGQLQDKLKALPLRQLH